MKRIILNEEFVVDIDPMNYILKRKIIIKSKNGEEKQGEFTIGFFSSLGECVKKISGIILKSNINGEIPINELLISIKKTEEHISTLISQLNANVGA